MNEEIDKAILAYLKSERHWRKVAMTVSRAAKSLGTKIPAGDDGYDLIHQRILFLFQAGSIDAQGDLNQWRYSEVRALPE
jgi:hypothetical protein